MSSKQLIERALSEADIGIDGAKSWDIRVRDPRFYDRVLADGSLGLGESYMDGWWDCERIDEMIYRVCAHGLKSKIKPSLAVFAQNLLLRFANRQSLVKARKVAHTHYDLGNEFFAHMLGPSMAYSCGYWQAAADVTEAQACKHDLICDKLALEATDRVLDIGCGWGSLAAHAARRTGCHVTGVTISEPQWSYGKSRCEDLPVTLMLEDYRSDQVRRAGPFHKVASVGMFEHVGARNYPRFMRMVHDSLTEDGIFLLHTIGNQPQTGVDVWVDKYIFPNSMVPCAGDIIAAARPYFVLEDWHNFGADYDRTLMAWHDNFTRYAASDEFPFDERFVRMWRYYLLAFAGAFRSRRGFQLWQIVLSKQGVRGGYRSIR